MILALLVALALAAVALGIVDRIHADRAVREWNLADARPDTWQPREGWMP